MYSGSSSKGVGRGSIYSAPTQGYSNNNKHDPSKKDKVRAAAQVALSGTPYSRGNREVKVVPLYQGEASIVEAKQLPNSSQRTAQLSRFFDENTAPPEERAEILFLLVKERNTFWKGSEYLKKEEELLKGLEEESNTVVAYKRLGELYISYSNNSCDKNSLLNWVDCIDSQNKNSFTGESLSRFLSEIAFAKFVINGKRWVGRPLERKVEDLRKKLPPNTKVTKVSFDVISKYKGVPISHTMGEYSIGNGYGEGKLSSDITDLWNAVRYCATSMDIKLTVKPFYDPPEKAQTTQFTIEDG